MEDIHANQFESWIHELNLELIKFRKSCLEDIKWISMLNNHVWTSACEAQFKFKNLFKKINPWTTTWLSLVKQTNILLSLTTLILYFNQDNADIYLAATLRAKLLLSTKEEIIKEWQFMLSSDLNKWIKNPQLLVELYDMLPPHNEKPVRAHSKQIKMIDKSFTVYHKKNEVNFEDEDIFKAVVENSLRNIPFIKLAKIHCDFSIAQKVKETIYGMKYIKLSKLNLLYAVNLQEPCLQEKINTIIENVIESNKIKVKMRFKSPMEEENLYEEALQRNLDRRKQRIIQILNSKRFGPKQKAQNMIIEESEDGTNPNKYYHPLFHFECENKYDTPPRPEGPSPIAKIENFNELKMEPKQPKRKANRKRKEFNWIDVKNVQIQCNKAKDLILKQENEQSQK